MSTLMSLILVACTALPEVDPIGPGRWVVADLHVHSSVGSNDTDGLGTPDALGPAMAAAGLDLVFLTDHSNSTGSMDCPTDDVEDCPNQGPELPAAAWPEGVIPANEISPVASLDFTTEPTGHVLCIPLDGASFPGLDAFVDRPTGTVTGGDAVAQCQDHGGFAIVAHPHALVPWIEYDWTSDAFDGLEVLNGTSRTDFADIETIEEEWEPRVADGRNVVPVGGSDSHRWGTPAPGDLTNPPLGWPATHIRVRDGETPIDALRAGRVIVAEPTTHLRMFAARGGRLAFPGERIGGPAIVQATASTQVHGLRLELKVAGGDILVDADLVPGEPSTITAEVPSGTVVYARVWPPGAVQALQGGVALSHVVRVD